MLGFSLLTSLVACHSDTPAEPATVREHLSSDLRHILTETKAASDGTTAQLPGASSLSLLAQPFLGASTSDTALRTLHRLAGPASADDEDSFDPDKAVAWLNENLFSDANYQGDGIYQVPASLVCPTDETDAIDADCAQKVAAADLRIYAVEMDGGLQLGVQVDADHDEPIAFALGHDKLTIAVDLDDASHAVAALAPLFGTTAPNAQLSGQIAAELDVLGTAHVKGSLSFDRAISVKLADEGVDLDGADAIRIASAKADVASIELDAVGKAGSVVLGLGATTAHLPAGEEDPSTDLDLPGATMVAMFANGQPLSITQIGLGNRTLKLSRGGVQAFALDLNPDDGRALSAQITADAATGSELLTVSPKLDVRVAVDHAALGDGTPVYDVTRMRLDNSMRVSSAGDRLQVVSGSFVVTTDPASYGITATAGQCIWWQEVSDAATQQSYMQWLPTTCN